MLQHCPAVSPCSIACRKRASNQCRRLQETLNIIPTRTIGKKQVKDLLYIGYYFKVKTVITYRGNSPIRYQVINITE